MSKRNSIDSDQNSNIPKCCYCHQVHTQLGFRLHLYYMYNRYNRYHAKDGLAEDDMPLTKKERKKIDQVGTNRPKGLFPYCCQYTEIIL